MNNKKIDDYFDNISDDELTKNILAAELLPCPFCGSGEVELFVDSVKGDEPAAYETSVGCGGCGIVVGFIGYLGYNEKNRIERKKMAIDHTRKYWNTRIG